MTNEEFSNEFDILYNNITSNQAPGLDEYEKSVFLTRAQDDIIKAYLDPRGNKYQEGFDNSERRQIDFSKILKVYSTMTPSWDARRIYKSTVEPTFYSAGEELPDPFTEEGVLLIHADSATITSGGNTIYLFPQSPNSFKARKDITEESVFYTIYDVLVSSSANASFGIKFDNRSTAVNIPSGILMILNETVGVVTSESEYVIKQVIPVPYVEYTRLMSKPFKRPLKNQVWRILNTNNSENSVSTISVAELILGPNDSFEQYTMRYVQRPKAIRLIDFTGDDLTIDGESTKQACELDPIIHNDILQRAVELAKAAYTGSLTDTIALGQTSGTNLGIVASQPSKK